MPVNYVKNAVSIPDRFLGSTLNSDLNLLQYIGRSARHLATNTRGWRERDPGRSAGEREILLAGCSWMEGMMEDFPNTIQGRLSQLLDIEIGNVGVSGYSLLQTIRRLHMEIEYCKPSLVIISFGDWMISRCFKYGTLNGLAFRPIFRPGKSCELAIIEPNPLRPRLFNEAFKLMQRADTLTRREKAIIDLIILENKIANGFASNAVRNFVGLRKYWYIDHAAVDRGDSEAADAYWVEIVCFCIDKLASLSEKYGCQICLVQMAVPHRRQTREEKDADLLGNLCATSDRLHFLGKVSPSPSLAGQRWEARDVNSPGESPRFWAEEHSHPNGAGYRRIAEEIGERLSQLHLV